MVSEPENEFQFAVLLYCCIHLEIDVCVVVYVIWLNIAGRIYIYHQNANVRDHFNGSCIEEIYRQNQLCKDIFNVMQNKANRTNNLHSFSHSLTLDGGCVLASANP